jgi:hypothetical protein
MIEQILKEDSISREIQTLRKKSANQAHKLTTIRSENDQLSEFVIENFFKF